jgi:glycosyltransferase involved in cell wall biosynthesis
VVVDPQDTAGFVEALRQFLDDESARSEAGARGRRYADATFDIQRIADRFEGIFAGACALRKSG